MPKTKTVFQLVILVSLCLFLSPGAWAHGHAHGHKKPDKRGILLVAFGSSYPQAQASFENIEARVKKAFPQVPVRWAYTSRIIRHKLNEKGKHYDSTAMALAKMMDEGFTHVAVQSLHTIPGAEFHDLRSIVTGFESMSCGFEKILLGYPLLSAPQDLVAVRDAMLNTIPEERKAGEAVIFMGHGTHHPSNAFYQAMAHSFQQEDPNVYVGTVEGSPSLEDILDRIEDKGTDTAYLMPFMSVAGDHVRNDMAGPGADSWKSILADKGIRTEAVLKGTAEYNTIADIWLDHLQDVFSHL
ncbi:sirohydrochlorin cobaltochelatase [Desulfovermiculus halophilus]|uniref:sirohydrochlorin cobaltochelatase n=1 Tax=Desulfovermiculus halophilus TaxID=339722 RepID=UPI0005589C73|nr:sirohydrochlorin cobaltochelatase [Desulfovermiculus halophilus]